MKTKSIGLLALLLAFIVQLTFAQEKTITGTVSDQNGLPLPGVNIVVVGTSKGTQTDFDGNYSISAETGQSISFSYIGMKNVTQTIGASSTINVQMEDDAEQLGEVVVTALGIKREKKSLGYSQQSVTGSDIVGAKNTDIGNALAGKIAGVQLVGQPSSSFSSALIRLRGETGVLFIVDNIKVNSTSDINMEDIADISVLKGVAGTALYGTEARNGAVIITTKSAKSGDSKITIDESYALSSLYLLPEYQNEYGGGYSQEFDTYNGQLIPNYSADESWGPRLDGTLVRHWDSWFPGTEEYGELRPWSANPNNVRDFYQTGGTNNITVGLVKGGDDYGIKATINNINQELILPNTENNQTTISLKTNYNISEKFKINGVFNYQYRKRLNYPDQGYGSLGSNFNQWWQRQLDINRLRDYYRNGQVVSWNMKSPTDPTPLYWNSPFFEVYESINHETKSAIYGAIGFDYQFNDYLAANFDVRRTSDIYNYDDRTAWYGLNLPSYREYTSQTDFTEVYSQLSYDRTFGNFDIIATAGVQWNQKKYKYLNASTVGGLQIPGFYSIATSVDNVSYNRDSYDRKNDAGFATASIGYKNYLYLDGSYRKEWSSTSYLEDNSVDAYGASASLIFSEFFTSDVFTFGKLRASIAQAPSHPGVYSLNPTYPTSTPYSSNVTMYNNNILPNSMLRGGVREEKEVGAEMRFFGSRLGLDFSYYQRTDDELPANVTLNGSTGYTATQGNQTIYETDGWELGLTASPFAGDNFQWNLAFNIAGYDKQVKKISDVASQTTIAGAWGGEVRNVEGDTWGSIYGYKWQRDDEGNILLSNTGRMQYTSTYEKIGDVQPDFVGGLTNNFRYKNLSLDFSIDFQKGGDYYSVTKMFNAYSGLGIQTVGNNNIGNPIRDAVTDASGNSGLTAVATSGAASTSGGVLVEGVDATTGDPASYYVEASTHFGRLYGIAEEWLYDASYVKLRQMQLGYTFPSKALKQMPLDQVYVGVFANNLWLIYSAVDGIDPSELEEYQAGGADLRWIEGGQSPSARTIGLNVKLTF